jgi:hypothetical protein
MVSKKMMLWTHLKVDLENLECGKEQEVHWQESVS